MQILWTRRAAAVVGALALIGAANVPPAHAESTALVMGGTAQPTPTEWAMENALDGILAGSTLVPITTPAEWWPLVGTLPWDESVAGGEQILLDAITETDGSIIVFGYSQGAYIASLAAATLAGRADAPDPDRITFILTANPGRPGGFLSLLPLGTNILGTTYTGGLQPASPYDVIDVAYEYDGIARSPKNPLRVLAGLNAILGAVYFHGRYSQVDLDDIPESDITRVPNEAGGVTSYYLVRQPNLPLLQPLRELGVDKRFVDGLNSFLTPFVKAAYPSEPLAADEASEAKPALQSAVVTADEAEDIAVQANSPSSKRVQKSARSADEPEAEKTGTGPETGAAPQTASSAAADTVAAVQAPSGKPRRPITRPHVPRHKAATISTPKSEAEDGPAAQKTEREAPSEPSAGTSE